MYMCLCRWCVYVHTCLCGSADLHIPQHTCGAREQLQVLVHAFQLVRVSYENNTYEQ